MGLYTPEYIYSARWTAAKGWHWNKERECENGTVTQWLDIFRKDEPNVEFVSGKKAPKYPAKAIQS